MKEERVIGALPWLCERMESSTKEEDLDLEGKGTDTF